METVNQINKIYELQFLKEGLIYIGSDIKARNLEEAKQVAMVFLQIPDDSELISSKETHIH
jgi:hypothetical protein|tara:strand:+ start:636 stop:818 length:183 start_codon:yes stop_codon:yes gene_type:complete